MNPYFEIERKSIILEGTTHPPYGEHKFTVYINDDCGHEHIHVNTDCLEVGKDRYRCCVHYDHKLCDTLEEFRKMTIYELEKSAYNCWMTGAR